MDVVAMPQLGETVTEGTITAWAKQVGDAVEIDDALFEVSTEKVDTEVPAAVGGYLRAVLVAEGATVPVGTPVAVMTETPDEPFDIGPAEDGEGTPAPEAGEPATGGAGGELPGGTDVGPDGRSPAGSRAAAQTPGATTDPIGTEEADRRARSPAVRRLLREHGLDPVDVAGSGRDGRITRADVLAAAARPRGTAPSPAPSSNHGPKPSPSRPPVVIAADDEVVDLSRARLATAEHMVRSLATAAHALVVTEVDYSRVEAARRAAGLSYLPFVARALMDALVQHPHINASVDGDRLVVHQRVHLGVAVDLDQEALVVPVLREADGLRLAALAGAIAEVADRARRRRLPGEAYAGGTFTITNVGAHGTLVTAPIINQPQVAICSTDGVRMAPVAVRVDDGAAGTEPAWGIAVHPVGNLCLSFDHRAFDGAYAAAFLARVRTELETRDWAEELRR